MPILTSLLAAIIPMLLYLIIIWRMDKYEREPLKLVVYHFLWGAVGAIIFALLGDVLLSYQFEKFIANQQTLSLVETILIAPFVEEITKGFFLVRTIASRKFDNLTDGLVYGGAIPGREVRQGSTMTENFLYFLAYGNTVDSWIAFVIIRSGFSAVMHCIATASFGAFLGMAKFSSPFGKTVLPFCGLLLAMFIHFLWNLSVSFQETYLLGFIFILVIIITFFITFFFSLRKEKEIIIKELIEEVKENRLPEAYISILSSQKRRKAGWIAEEIRKDFINAAVKLAFRKTQYKHTFGKNKMFYWDEVLIYRDRLKQIIEQSMQTISD